MHYRVEKLGALPRGLQWLVTQKMLTPDQHGPLYPWVLCNHFLVCSLFRPSDESRLTAAVRFAMRFDDDETFAAWLPSARRGEHSVVVAYLEDSALVETHSYPTVWEWLHSVIDDVREAAERD